jgi:hypothetical protein
MNKIKISKPVSRDNNGSLVLNFDADESSFDWLGYSWIKKLAGEGDEEAKKEIERINASQMVPEVKEDEAE